MKNIHLNRVKSSNSLIGRIGAWFFRKRSFLVLLVLVPLIIMVRPGQAFNSEIIDEVLGILGIGIMLLGAFLRMLVVGYRKPGTSSRGDKIHAHELITDGAYQICRNPLYLGNLLLWVGLTIIFWNIWFFIAIGAWFFIQYYFIIKAEELYLAKTFGQVYNNYRKEVPAFIPRIRRFRKPERSFNWNEVIHNKEINTFFLVIAIPILIEIYDDLTWKEINPKTDIMVLLIGFSMITVLAWSIMRYMKRL